MSHYSEFIHPNHISIFIDAARTYNCHILVRKTGRASLRWVGKRGYTGKRADMKAKTAKLDLGKRQIAGLVCSPYLLPQAFPSEHLVKAQKEWGKCAHLITVPEAGFDDQRQAKGCMTPYMLQTNKNHKHYGCVALVEHGLLIPRYIHGDYDLYAIIPAGKAFNPDTLKIRRSKLGSTMRPGRMGLEQYIKQAVPNLEGPLSFPVSNYINLRISSTGADLLGGLMVNHGAQIALGKDGQDFQEVLAIAANQGHGEPGKISILRNKAEHKAFYGSA